MEPADVSTIPKGSHKKKSHKRQNEIYILQNKRLEKSIFRIIKIKAKTESCMEREI